MNPKLRSIDVQWIQHDGQPLLMLRDRLDLSDRTLAVPAPLAPLLAMCDGSRDPDRLRSAFELRTGMRISSAQMEQLLERLDEALLLESPRYAAALRAATEAYRAAPFRPPALAGHGYPADAAELRGLLDSFGEGVSAGSAPTGADSIRGVVCPHINYRRGGAAYARSWLPAAEAVRRAEVIVTFGTDHQGSAGALTLTTQRYATPWGPLPADSAVVEALADALGPAAFAEELHHRAEHSIELAAVWLHYLMGERPAPVVPVLCGSFHEFVAGAADPAEIAVYDRALAALRAAVGDRRLLVVAAADLAHVGPAFGDERPLGPAEKAALAAADRDFLSTVVAGDAAVCLRAIRALRDRHRVCGLPPIYFALRLLDGARGEAVAYQQCPADPGGGSVVSVAGAWLR